ncbi:hypothetical protein LAY57_05005 [Argonema antarcticum A004/B2]|nr:hypothetical protein [Argonema antarcticum A004/B2]
MQVANYTAVIFSLEILRERASGLKLGYQGSKSYLTPTQMAEIKEWLILPERRNTSELERYLIEEYDVVFKS